VPVIIDHHNAEHLILQRYAALERNPAKKLYAWLESRKIRAWEQKACERAAVALDCSARDLDVLRSLAPQTQFFVVPNVVDVNHYRPDPGREQPHTIVFQGGMDWYPNRDAVQFFIAEILPQVRSSFSDVKFIVAGRNPPEAFRRQCEATAGVVFTGTVDDMRSVIARAAISVVPLRIGSGTRLKILEAAAMGKAIVSTSLGAEGLDFRSSDDILIADRAPDFAAAVTTLLADAVARRRIGLAARQRVEELYSSAALRAAIRPALELVGSDRLVPA
jgi:glycosyltransferase involved in cell wall biosynthesis